MQISRKAQGAALVGVVGALGLSAGASGAVLDGIILEEGRYKLCNHPDGGHREPGYGLILAGLYDAPGDDKDLFSFDFEHEESQMWLSWDGTKITIQGEVYGGRDIGDDWADDQYKGVYNVFFEYQLAEKFPGDNDLYVENENAGDNGWIQPEGGDKIDLWSKANDEFAFRLGDETDDNGHRGFDGISGWGWLNHANREAPSDWLFTLKIPTPGSVALAMAAVPFMSIRRRRA